MPFVAFRSDKENKGVLNTRAPHTFCIPFLGRIRHFRQKNKQNYLSDFIFSENNTKNIIENLKKKITQNVK